MACVVMCTWKSWIHKTLRHAYRIKFKIIIPQTIYKNLIPQRSPNQQERIVKYIEKRLYLPYHLKLS